MSDILEISSFFFLVCLGDVLSCWCDLKFKTNDSDWWIHNNKRERPIHICFERDKILYPQIAYYYSRQNFWGCVCDLIKLIIHKSAWITWCAFSCLFSHKLLLRASCVWCRRGLTSDLTEFLLCLFLALNVLCYHYVELYTNTRIHRQVIKSIWYVRWMLLYKLTILVEKEVTEKNRIQDIDKVCRHARAPLSICCEIGN